VLYRNTGISTILEVIQARHQQRSNDHRSPLSYQNQTTLKRTVIEPIYTQQQQQQQKSYETIKSRTTKELQQSMNVDWSFITANTNKIGIVVTRRIKQRRQTAIHRWQSTIIRQLKTLSLGPLSKHLLRNTTEQTDAAKRRPPTCFESCATTVANVIIPHTFAASSISYKFD
jgi:hypothetical protein